MKKIVVAILAVVLVIGHFSFAHAEYVSGYLKSDGTYVQGYQRSDPDGSPYDNYDYPGNYNPNTGEDTPGNDSTYLNNYYKDSDGSSDTSGDSSLYDDTTPSCPDNSYESGDQCQCDAGYINQSGSCVDADSYCDDNHGYESSYDSLSDSCTCNAGYTMDSTGQCIDEDTSCQNQIGDESSYDSVDNTCECNAGYVLNSDQTECISEDDYCQNQYGINSSYDDSTDRCACDDGYTYQSGECTEAADDTPDITSNTDAVLPVATAPVPEAPVLKSNPTPSMSSDLKNFFNTPVSNAPAAPVNDFLSTITQSTNNTPTPVPPTVKSHHWYSGLVNFVKKVF